MPVRVGPDEVLQHELQLGGCLRVTALVRLADVVEDHAPDQTPALRRPAQMPAHLQGDDLGQVLVPGDDADLPRRELAQSQAIVVGQHRSLPPSAPVLRLGQPQGGALIWRNAAASGQC
jgi:hypothetical protein